MKSLCIRLHREDLSQQTFLNLRSRDGWLRQQRAQFINRPNVIRQARFHCRGDSQSLMDAPKVGSQLSFKMVSSQVAS